MEETVSTRPHAAVPFLEELEPTGPLHLVRPSSQQEAANRTSGDEPVRRLYLADVKDSGKHVTPYAFFDKSKLNVDSDKAGIAFWLDWLGEIAEVAILEKRDPKDPEYPKLKPVGVYPVIKGWAHIDLEQMAGKGQDYYSSTVHCARNCDDEASGLGPGAQAAQSELCEPHIGNAKEYSRADVWAFMVW